MGSKTAFITGLTGQDGSYLAEFLLEKGYKVAGLVRRTSSEAHSRVEHLRGRISLYHGDLLDQTSLVNALRRSEPDEVYNLAAQTYVATSWEQPVFTGEVTALGVTRMLDAVRQACPHAKFYQASSSEMFGDAAPPQGEYTPLLPRSPYGAAKVYGHGMVRCYRESYGMFACSGILFNHESPRRGMEFVTRKIAHAVAAIKAGRATHVNLGNLAAKRDWGYAGDYVRAMWLMLQREEPQDFVVGTGETHSVEDFARRAFARVGLWWGDYVRVDPSLIRPAEVNVLRADARRAREVLRWNPTVGFAELVDMMVDAELDKIRQAAERLDFLHPS